jgi:hypothetical protein
VKKDSVLIVRCGGDGKFGDSLYRLENLAAASRSAFPDLNIYVGHLRARVPGYIYFSEISNFAREKK